MSKITAAIANGVKRKSNPKIKLAMAFPLVCVDPAPCALLAGIAAASADTVHPQTRQNLSSALTLLPQPAQNVAIATPRRQTFESFETLFRPRTEIGTKHTIRWPRRQCASAVHLPPTPRFDMVPTMDETRDETGNETRTESSVPLTLCPDCAAQMPATAAFCPGCGRSMLSQPMLSQTQLDPPVQGQTVPSQPVPIQPMPEARAHGSVGALPESIAGALAYLTFVPAVLFLVLEPYSKNRFVRFHSVQSLLLWGASVLFAIALKLASVILFIIPVLGPLLVWLVSTVVLLAAVVIWVVLVVKALQGEMFRLPTLGDFAAQQAGEL
jgi:uncharacterized membrane protein